MRLTGEVSRELTADPARDEALESGGFLDMKSFRLILVEKGDFENVHSHFPQHPKLLTTVNASESSKGGT